MRLSKTIQTCLLLSCLCLSPLFINSCDKGDDEPSSDIENNGEGSENNGGGSETDYNPNSDHALGLALKEHGYGSIINANLEKAIIGKWQPVCWCAVYWKLLENGNSCDDYDGGFQFNDNKMCYYLDSAGQVEGNAHSWSISDGMLRILNRGNADDRMYPKMTSKGYLILQWHGSSCWTIYKKN